MNNQEMKDSMGELLSHVKDLIDQIIDKDKQLALKTSPFELIRTICDFMEGKVNDVVQWHLKEYLKTKEHLKDE